MAIQWQSGCLRVEIQDSAASHPFEERHARLFIRAVADGGKECEVASDGQIGVQLAHLLHACVVLSGGEDEEWFIPNSRNPLHLRRQGRTIEIARYPGYTGHSTDWLVDDGFYFVDFGSLLDSLSAAVEWVMDDLPEDFAEDDMVQVLIHQWERAWQRFSRLATFRRVTFAVTY
jgi:hypothetical protein